MGALIRWGVVLSLVFWVSCATTPPPASVSPVPELPRVTHTPALVTPLTVWKMTPPSAPTPVRQPPPAPSFRETPIPSIFAWEMATGLNWDSWPYGWVDDQEQGARLGIDLRFWSDQRLTWLQALDDATSLAAQARVLENLFKTAATPEEAFRAAWHLWLVNSRALRFDSARGWLDQAARLKPLTTVTLDQAWDQNYRLQDPHGARNLFPGPGAVWPQSVDVAKAKLLKQRLFLQTKTLTSVGADDFVSTLTLDRDDLWIGTWNGAVVRWSLLTKTMDLLKSADVQVTPVKLLTATDWFIYAFQDQLFQRYSKVTGTWRSFPYPPDWTGLRIQGVVAEGDQVLWVAYLGQGLWRWSEGVWTLMDDRGAGPFLNALVPDGEGGFWVGTKDRGLWGWKAGQWTEVPGTMGRAPSNISVIVPHPGQRRWAVGTWGEGAWVLEAGQLKPQTKGKEFVPAASWTEVGPLWAFLDEGLAWEVRGEPQTLGPGEGISAGGVTALVSWSGRWIWGTNGQGLAWWSEYENPALLR